MWGLLTLYWPLLDAAGSVEILAHRIAWTMVLVCGALLVRRRWAWLKPLLRSPRALLGLTAGAALISVNWGVFIWSVTHSHVVEASLGYYINPLVSVLLGVVVLRERLDPLRWFAVGLAAAGVLWLAVDYGRPPWISLALAFSFGGYGLFKKLATVTALESLTVESTVLFLPAVGYLVWLSATGAGTFATAEAGAGHSVLLMCAGLATAVPLLLFGASTARIPLFLVGLLQYLTPTMQLIIGVFVLGETVHGRQLVGFALVWAALVLLSAAMLRRAGTTKLSRSLSGLPAQPT